MWGFKIYLKFGGHKHAYNFIRCNSLVCGGLNWAIGYRQGAFRCTGMCRETLRIQLLSFRAPCTNLGDS